MPYQAFDNDSIMFRQVILQIDTDGIVPVNFIWTRAIRAGGAVEAAPYRLDQWIRQFALQLLYHFAHNVTRRVFGLLRNNFAEREQGSDKMNIGIHLLQHAYCGLWEVGANVAEPARVFGRGTAETCRAFRVVKRLKHAVHAHIALAQRQAASSATFAAANS